MSLFPAYAQDVDLHVVPDTDGADREVCASDGRAVIELSPAREVQLLASDDEAEQPAEKQQPATARADPCDEHFYYDTKLDCGNLRVSTLYYPGRPQYRRSVRVATWARSEPGRYWAPGGAAGAGGDARAAEGAEGRARVGAVRRALARQPEDVRLWLHLLHLQENWGSESEALAAAEEAVARVPCARLRDERHRLRCLHLPHDELLSRLRVDIDREAEGSRARAEAWERLVRVAGARGGPEAGGAALRGALSARAPPAAYPRLLLAHGASLRAAGLWERLVLLLELVAAMNFPSVAFPPPPGPAADDELQEREDEIIASGLPLSTVWVRVERARAELHWRAAAGDAADPQRTPLPADVADLLLPVSDPDAVLLLAVNVLRLAKVPLLGVSAAGLEALGGAAEGGACGEELLALGRAGRRLPPAHPARLPAPAARRALALLLDPPHYLSDRAGFLSWCHALWDACCAAVEGERRTALVCWRLRWLAALGAALGEGPAEGPGEAARLRSCGRAVLRRWAGGAALCYAQWARLERALGAGGAGLGAEGAGLGAALHALRAAAREPSDPHHHLLYLARVVSEVSEGAPAGLWAVASAALARQLPPQHALGSPPPPELLHDAFLACQAQCSQLERSLGLGEEADDCGAAGAGDEGEGEGALWALLPDRGGEWAAARALLAPPARRPALAAALRAAAPRARRPAAARYCEHAACALACVDRTAALQLAPLFPNNPLLALVNAGAPLWVRRWGADEGAQRAHVAHRATGALASLLPALGRALGGGWRAQDAARLCAASARAGEGGALVWAARLEAEGRAPRPRARHALYAALDRHPHHKWLHVRGAAWAGSEAAALADVLLERQLRLHALPDELLPPNHPPPDELHPPNLNK